MQYRTLDPSEIEALNAEARHCLETGRDTSATDAIGRVINTRNWREIHEGTQCSVYRTETGAYVNVWWESPASEAIEEGGVGFDDEVAWAFEPREDLDRE